MKAEEIRAAAQKIRDEIKAVGESQETLQEKEGFIRGMLEMNGTLALIEIAAQLADLNTQLRRSNGCIEVCNRSV